MMTHSLGTNDGWPWTTGTDDWRWLLRRVVPLHSAIAIGASRWRVAAMSITPELKRLFADREAAEERKRIAVAMENSPKKLEEHEAAMKMVDLAQPFIDEHGADSTKWKPSSLLRIGYCTLATGDNPKSALPFIERHLRIARKRYLAGLDPNPFLTPTLPLPEPPAE